MSIPRVEKENRRLLIKQDVVLTYVNVEQIQVESFWCLHSKRIFRKLLPNLVCNKMKNLIFLSFSFFFSSVLFWLLFLFGFLLWGAIFILCFLCFLSEFYYWSKENTWLAKVFSNEKSTSSNNSFGFFCLFFLSRSNKKRCRI